MRCYLPGLTCFCLAATLCAQPTGTMTPQVQILHAYTLAELGRHGDSVNAFEQARQTEQQTRPIGGPNEEDAALIQERAAYTRALQYTQDCGKDNACMAEDFLAIGKFSEALSWQKRRLKSIHDGEKTHLRRGEEESGGGITVRLGDETDSTGGRSTELADAYDLQARIEAAMSHQAAALKDLDAALKALPDTKKNVPREAGYAYHRALILAENQRYTEAASACRNSLSIDSTTATLGERRPLQCAAIEKLASGPG